MDSTYGGLVWTNHALDRLKERGISQGDAWFTWKKPDQSRFAKSKNAWIYYKTYKGEKIEVVVKKGSGGKWVVMSVWSHPVRTMKTKLPGNSSGFFHTLTRFLLKRK